MNIQEKRQYELSKQRQYELSKRMYRVLYPNDKPNYNLTTKQFMELLFILDELSMNPLLNRELKEVE